MGSKRSSGDGIALGVLLITSLLPVSPITQGLRYAAAGYWLLSLMLRARDGYHRRKSYWTRASWRRFFVVCAVPALALLSSLVMAAAFEWQLPIVGEARSTARSLWALGTVATLVIGVGGLVVAIEWFARGEPSRQVVWPRWIA